MSRTYWIRMDLFICMILAGLLWGGLGYAGEKLNLSERIFEVVSTSVLNTKDVPDGEVGGYATDDTPRVEKFEDLIVYALNDMTFTVEARATQYFNYGSFVADNYEWRILKLKDDTLMAVKLNTKKIISGEGTANILPVGKVVMEVPGAYEDMKNMVSGSGNKLVSDAYIDMDGEANSTLISPKMKITAALIWVITSYSGVIIFVVYILTVFGMHAIGTKFNIFPPLFPKKKMSSEK